MVSHDGLCYLLVPNANTVMFFNSHGRFFAVSQMKVLLARIIMTYDVKFEEGKGVPREHRMGVLRFPRDTVVLFRKRRM